MKWGVSGDLQVVQAAGERRVRDRIGGWISGQSQLQKDFDGWTEKLLLNFRDRNH